MQTMSDTGLAALLRACGNCMLQSLSGSPSKEWEEAGAAANADI